MLVPTSQVRKIQKPWGSSPHGWGGQVTTVQKDMATAVSRGCELRQLPHPPQEGEMLVEQCCFQMKKSHSKGLGKSLSDEAVWLFPAGDGSHGLLDPSALIPRLCWEQGLHAWHREWEHPSSLGAASQGCHGWLQGPTAARAEQGQAPCPTGTATSWRVTHASMAQSPLQNPAAPEINLSEAEHGASAESCSRCSP